MPTNEQHDRPAGAAPADEAAQQAAAEAARQRIWESPIGTGEPIAFDPAIHKAPMSQEELEAVLGKDDE
jgi:hypothetical protein